jgi:hypothetical protein
MGTYDEFTTSTRSDGSDEKKRRAKNCCFACSSSGCFPPLCYQPVSRKIARPKNLATEQNTLAAHLHC